MKTKRSFYKTLFWGAGDTSVKQYKLLLKRLREGHDVLSGLQQGVHPNTREAIDGKAFIRDVIRDVLASFGYSDRGLKFAPISEKLMRDALAKLKDSKGKTVKLPPGGKLKVGKLPKTSRIRQRGSLDEALEYQNPNFQPNVYGHGHKSVAESARKLKPRAIIIDDMDAPSKSMSKKKMAALVKPIKGMVERAGGKMISGSIDVPEAHSKAIRKLFNIDTHIDERGTTVHKLTSKKHHKTHTGQTLVGGVGGKRPEVAKHILWDDSELAYYRRGNKMVLRKKFYGQGLPMSRPLPKTALKATFQPLLRIRESRGFPEVYNHKTRKWCPVTFSTKKIRTDIEKQPSFRIPARYDVAFTSGVGGRIVAKIVYKKTEKKPYPTEVRDKW